MIAILLLPALIVPLSGLPHPQAGLTQAKQSGPEAKPASIRGKVMAADNGVPLKMARVYLRPRDNPMQSLGATTDKQGLFEITGITPGRYVLTCVKPGYVSIGWGGSRTGQASSVLTIEAADTLKNINFSLPRGAVIAGQIIDDDGEPVVGVSVQALARNYRDSGTKFRMGGSTLTDDRGSFRIHDLPAGRYYLQSAPYGSGPNSPAAYSVTLYPGVSQLSDAQPLTLLPGGELLGIKMVMRPESVHSLGGRLIDAVSGAPIPETRITLRPENVLLSAALSGQTRDDGSFQITGVGAGMYRATVGRLGTRMVEMPRSDVTQMQIRIGPGVTINGILKADGGKLPSTVQVILESRSLINPERGGLARVAPDGTFTISKVPPGAYELKVNPQSMLEGAGGYYLREVTAADKDVTDSGVIVTQEFGELAVSVTVDFHGGVAKGSLADDDHHPLPSIPVVLIPSDIKLRNYSRYLRRVSTDSNGQFEIRSIIPGDYLLIPWPGEESGQLQDESVLEKVKSYAERVSVQGGATVTKELKVGKALREIVDSLQ